MSNKQKFPTNQHPQKHQQQIQSHQNFHKKDSVVQSTYKKSLISNVNNQNNCNHSIFYLKLVFLVFTAVVVTLVSVWKYRSFGTEKVRKFGLQPAQFLTFVRSQNVSEVCKKIGSQNNQFYFSQQKYTQQYINLRLKTSFVTLCVVFLMCIISSVLTLKYSLWKKQIKTVKQKHFIKTNHNFQSSQSRSKRSGSKDKLQIFFKNSSQKRRVNNFLQRFNQLSRILLLLQMLSLLFLVPVFGLFLTVLVESNKYNYIKGQESCRMFYMEGQIITLLCFSSLMILILVIIIILLLKNINQVHSIQQKIQNNKISWHYLPQIKTLKSLTKESPKKQVVIQEQKSQQIKKLSNKNIDQAQSGRRLLYQPQDGERFQVKQIEEPVVKKEQSPKFPIKSSSIVCKQEKVELNQNSRSKQNLGNNIKVNSDNSCFNNACLTQNRINEIEQGILPFNSIQKYKQKSDQENRTSPKVHSQKRLQHEETQNDNLPLNKIYNPYQSIKKTAQKSQLDRKEEKQIKLSENNYICSLPRQKQPDQVRKIKIPLSDRLKKVHQKQQKQQLFKDVKKVQSIIENGNKSPKLKEKISGSINNNRKYRQRKSRSLSPKNENDAQIQIQKSHEQGNLDQQKQKNSQLNTLINMIEFLESSTHRAGTKQKFSMTK